MYEPQDTDVRCSTMVSLLLDAHNLLYRSFTSLPRSIADDNNQPINAVYGMLAYVARLSRELSGDHILAAFDTPDVPTFRHKLYPAYQGQRGPLGGEHAEDFARQIDIAQTVLPRLDVPAYVSPGYEADDILGSLACRLAVHGVQCIIVSTDRDLLQLVGQGIETLAPGNPPRLARDEGEVKERLGVAPGGVTTFKALAGDASDNIPGVRGIGAKTAASLVNEHGSLEAIYSALATLPPRIQGLLAEGRDDAFLFREVATLVTDLELNFDVEHLPRHAFGLDAKPRQLLRDAGYA
jgi:DNA polymerase-1